MLNLLKPLRFIAKSRASLLNPLGAVLYFPGQPGTGGTITDYSGQGVTGTLTGTTWTNLGTGLWVLSYDGVDDGIITNLTAFPTTAFTLLAWVKGTGAFNGYVFGRLNSSWAAGSNGDVGYPMSTTSMGLYGKWGGVERDYQTTIASTAGVWYLVGGTWDGATVTNYRNGAAIGTPAAEAWAFNASSLALYIGRRQLDGSKAPFAGDIALPRVWNTALSGSEINRIYNTERWLFGV